MSSLRCTFPALPLTLLFGTLFLPAVFPQSAIANDLPSNAPGGTTTEMIAGEGLQPFRGTWKFDYEKTMEGYRQSPDYDPEGDFEALSGLLNFMFGMVTLTISGNQLQMAVTDSDEVNTIDCVPTSSTGNVVMAQCTKEGDTKTIKFENVLPGEYMKFNAVGEDECPYCTWRKVD